MRACARDHRATKAAPSLLRKPGKRSSCLHPREISGGPYKSITRGWINRIEPKHGFLGCASPAGSLDSGRARLRGGLHHSRHRRWRCSSTANAGIKRLIAADHVAGGGGRAGVALCRGDDAHHSASAVGVCPKACARHRRFIGLPLHNGLRRGDFRLGAHGLVLLAQRALSGVYKLTHA